MDDMHRDQKCGEARMVRRLRLRIHPNLQLLLGLQLRQLCHYIDILYVF